VAMGLVKDGDAHTILTDIQGMEDALGDMDFKVAGTTEGVTAIQMDIKVAGISREILSDALAQAKRGRSFILGKMLEVISEPAADLSPYAPRVRTLKIAVDKIREVIGTGGKIINRIIEETGVDIDINDDGQVFVTSKNVEGIDRAVEIIEQIVHDVTIGEVYEGPVTRIMPTGAFVEIAFGKEAMCHISQLSDKRIPTVEDAVKVGDMLKVKITEIDDKGRINASHRALLEGDAPKPRNFDRPPRSDDRPPRNFDRQSSNDRTRTSDRPRSNDRTRSNDRPSGNFNRSRSESRTIKDFKDLKNSRDSRRRRDR
ncbi:MAG: S1 RNA-binding domain-containing protein, partial [Selenomonadaceae bacterium]|nr:S1 RNA-binding domain-containing protein [Selenomonadaceae bacterium]